jgi:hypothetical protein
MVALAAERDKKDNGGQLPTDQAAAPFNGQLR